MSALLAERCREEPLVLTVSERTLQEKNSQPIPAHACQRDAFLGLFFDGTNNNKYRDLSGRFTNSASNVARLFEAFSGNVAELKPTYGGKADKPLLVGVADGNYNFHRKVYIPGLGTGFSEVNDSGENLTKEERGQRGARYAAGGDKMRGLSMALYGEDRIRWGLLQVLEQIHRMFKGKELNSAQLITHWCTHSQGDSLVVAALKINDVMRSLLQLSEALSESFDDFFVQSLKSLEAALTPSDRKKVRTLRISIFGFSRGAAEARAFANRLQKLAPNHLGGMPYQIDFLGIFDTVASVGLANLTPRSDGHMAWAHPDALKIPSSVRRCVHLVAAHEVRRCFPLDALGNSSNRCLEVVYPGVHSDVGGGYPPRDQGRCKEDADKISQISLAHMYREARMMGVPLAASTDMPPAVAELFAVAPDLRTTFNAYIERTQCGPQDTAKQIQQQYSHYLAWRKYRLNDIIPKTWLRGADTEIQDLYDVKQTNEILQKIELDGQQRSFHSTGLAIWKKAQLDPNKDKAIIDLFDLYVHDSRAWFKLAGDTDDEWFGGGKAADGKARPSKREKARVALLKEKERLERQVTADKAASAPSADGENRRLMRIASSTARLAAIDKELKDGEGQPLVNGGVSSQENVDFTSSNLLGIYGAGYLTMRDIYPDNVPAKASNYIKPKTESTSSGSSYPAKLQG
ncbi:DUF2235 domain-containing protein [uncultured Deefgea sp.]|uniref:T6SS phospholipase effector Tle1-like catalytic domain-containing protein n=1 Tax=uncultured Deefgea sp. TaxID=1304914 RepID=UPI0026204985|nr:DUF2235 domain-containing protein [uncultured Deefgea sp.]